MKRTRNGKSNYYPGIYQVKPESEGDTTNWEKSFETGKREV